MGERNLSKFFNENSVILNRLWCQVGHVGRHLGSLSASLAPELERSSTNVIRASQHHQRRHDNQNVESQLHHALVESTHGYLSSKSLVVLQKS